MAVVLLAAFTRPVVAETQTAPLEKALSWLNGSISNATRVDAEKDNGVAQHSETFSASFAMPSACVLEISSTDSVEIANRMSGGTDETTTYDRTIGIDLAHAPTRDQTLGEKMLYDTQVWQFGPFGRDATWVRERGTITRTGSWTTNVKGAESESTASGTMQRPVLYFQDATSASAFTKALARMAALCQPATNESPLVMAETDRERFEMAQAALDAHDCVIAIAALETAQDPVRRQLSWVSLAARAHDCAGDLEEALRLYQLVREMNPKDPTIDSKIGDLLYRISKKAPPAKEPWDG